MKIHTNIANTVMRKSMCYDYNIKLFPKVVMEVVYWIVDWCDKENPQTEEEKMVSQYGAELLIENFSKIFLLLLMGFTLEKGYESVVFLSVFSILRTQAGGFHCKTGWGCTLCMIGVWGIGIFGAEMVEIPLIMVCAIFIISVCVILWKAPKTINRVCYTLEDIKCKKVNSIMILSLSFVVSILCYSLRTLIMFAVALEVITLLPKNIFHLRRK